MDKENKLVVFEGQNIRRIEQDGQIYLAIVDVIAVLTDSANPRNYWKTLKNREPQLVTFCNQLKLEAADGKKYLTDCANTEGVLRIIMSVPSPKAEPFKLWMADLGKQNIAETENPELGFERLEALYRAKGMPDEWITRRLQSIETRKRLTDEWQKRGVTEGSEYSFLTAEIAKATFGLTPSEHSQLKGLEKTKDNLRDHMSPLELIFTALGEEATRLYAVEDDAQGYNENHAAAQKGGTAAGGARATFEKLRNSKVVSSESYLKQIESQKALEADSEIDGKEP